MGEPRPVNESCETACFGDASMDDDEALPVAEHNSL
jgi:hypothetical protein